MQFTDGSPLRDLTVREFRLLLREELDGRLFTPATFAGCTTEPKRLVFWLRGILDFFHSRRQAQDIKRTKVFRKPKKEKLGVQLSETSSVVSVDQAFRSSIREEYSEQDASVTSVPSTERTDYLQPSFRSDNPIIRCFAQHFSPDVMLEMTALIEDLDLVPVSVSWTKQTTDEGSNT